MSLKYKLLFQTKWPKGIKTIYNQSVSQRCKFFWKKNYLSQLWKNIQYIIGLSLSASLIVSDSFKWNKINRWKLKHQIILFQWRQRYNQNYLPDIQCDQIKIAKSIQKLPKKISQEKWMILTPLQKLPNNVGNLGKIIVANGFEMLPKVQKITQSGHTAVIGQRWSGKTLQGWNCLIWRYYLLQTCVN